MLEIIGVTIAFLGNIVASLWGIISISGVWIWEVLYNFHVNAPRLEGLIIGVLFAWLLARKDRHPLLKLVSAPLRLVIDILDLVWDQAIEFLCDIKDIALGWLRKGMDVPRDLLKSGYSRLNKKLASIKNRLLKK